MSFHAMSLISDVYLFGVTFIGKHYTFVLNIEFQDHAHTMYLRGPCEDYVPSRTIPGLYIQGEPCVDYVPRRTMQGLYIQGEPCLDYAPRRTIPGLYIQGEPCLDYVPRRTMQGLCT